MKVQNYQQITQTGLELRTYNEERHRGHILKSDRYTADIATALSTRENDVRLAIRAMRADMVLAQATLPDEQLAQQFSATAEVYLTANLKVPPSQVSPAVVALDRNWDHRNVESFYRNIYTTKGARALGGWTPYEMELLSLFYTQEATRGNHLTIFDRMVLGAYSKGVPGNQAVSDVRGLTGIQVNEGVIERHRNILVYGRPAYSPKLE